MNDDILGIDLAEDENGDLAIDAARGDIKTVAGQDCLLADIKMSLDTPPGGLIDDPYEGILVSREGANTDLTVLAMKQKYKALFKAEPRIKPNSVKVYEPDDVTSSFSASFETITDQVIDNFVL